jgi:hypothetical protein
VTDDYVDLTIRFKAREALFLEALDVVRDILKYLPEKKLHSIIILKGKVMSGTIPATFAEAKPLDVTEINLVAGGAGDHITAAGYDQQGNFFHVDKYEFSVGNVALDQWTPDADGQGAGVLGLLAGNDVLTVTDPKSGISRQIPVTIHELLALKDIVLLRQ